MAVDTDVIKRSVTQNDIWPGMATGAVAYNYFLPMGPRPTLKLLPELPPFWSTQRDWILSATIDTEPFWSGAIAIAVTKMSSRRWEVKSDVDLRRKRFQQIFLTINAGMGWVSFLEQHLQDYLLTDNGAFIEIVRATQGSGSRIIGLMHLDSHRCTRTGDPEVPVIYRDRMGRNHFLRDYQVIALADMPSPSETYFGVGRCAASRVYKKIQRMAVIDRYVLEKVSGARATSLHFLTGITDAQLNQALNSQATERKAVGGIAYGGAVLIPFMRREGISHVEIEFAKLPDNFDAKQELDQGLLSYANGIGLDIQELQPLSGQALGTGAQSQVLDDKQRGKGLFGWSTKFEHLINQYVCPDTVVFYFTEKDYRDMLQQAQVDSTRANTAAALVDKTILSGDQAKILLVEQDVLPRTMLPEGTNLIIESLDDSEKPAIDGIITAADNANNPNDEDQVSGVNINVTSVPAGGTPDANSGVSQAS